MTNALLMILECCLLRKLLEDKNRQPQIQVVENIHAVPIGQASPIYSIEGESPIDLLPKKRDIVFEHMVDLICSSESFFSEEYICPSGKRTIGYGFTEKKYLDMKILSKERALDILKNELIPKYRDLVRKYVKVPLNDHQEAALISFTFNCGEGSLNKLVGQAGRLNSGNYDSVAKYLPKYVYGKKNGKPIVYNGLVVRRKKELNLFLGNI
jgi:lysozyme